jgi:uncharacterized membrane protein
MEASVSEWLNLVLRWFHIIAGISWIGSSFYFMWLDSSLEAPAEKSDTLAGSLWMVHSGGFYRVEKRYLAAGQVPPNLHWFKWEAAFTWLSGFFLLLVVYYFGGLMLDTSGTPLSAPLAAAVGTALLVVAWAAYDGLWMVLGDRHKLGAVVCFALLVGVAYALTQYLGGRAAYIHIGAMLGTLMVANVWMRILPAQRQMIAATQRGEARDSRLAARAKLRSVHNNYMTFPVIFIMISNHFPSTYGHPWNWAVLAVLFLASAGVRHHLNVASRATAWLVVLATLSVLALVYVTAS